MNEFHDSSVATETGSFATQSLGVHFRTDLGGTLRNQGRVARRGRVSQRRSTHFVAGSAGGRPDPRYIGRGYVAREWPADGAGDGQNPNKKGEKAQKAFLMKSLVLTAFVVAVLVCSGAALAQVKDPAQIDQRLGPPNFGPLGDQGCAVGEVISDLRVTLQVTHTWVGDLAFELTHDDTGTSALIFDRPGVPNTLFGCSGDNIDAVLYDSAPGGSVEAQCLAGVPTINGEFVPDPDLLAAFAGEELTGKWTLAVTQRAQPRRRGDGGTLDTWCLAEGTGGVCCSSPGIFIPPIGTIADTLDLGGGNGDVPATSTWGVIALMALFMGVSLYFLRRRRSASA